MNRSIGVLFLGLWGHVFFSTALSAWPQDRVPFSDHGLKYAIGDDHGSRLKPLESPESATKDRNLVQEKLTDESSPKKSPVSVDAKSQEALNATPKPVATAYPTVKINGAFQSESYWFGQDEANRLTLGRFDPRFNSGLSSDEVQAIGNLKDGAGFRRTRLSAAGAVTEEMKYMVQMDFGFFGRPTFMDVWADYENLPGGGTLRVGQWKQPFGLEVVSSYRYTTFLERSLLFQAFTPFRHIGVGWRKAADDEMSTLAISAFRTGNDQFGNDIAERGGYSAAVRQTILTWYQECCGELDYCHLGIAGWAGTPSDYRFRYATVPEGFAGAFGAAPLGSSLIAVPTTSNGTPPFVNTGLLDIRSFAHLGLEALWVRGPFSIQSETMVSTADQIGAGT